MTAAGFTTTVSVATKEIHMSEIITMEQELLKVVRKLINFPFNQICVHSAALDILSVLDETYSDDPHWEELIKSVHSSSVGDVRATEILDQIIGEANAT
jgi:hypothetical protein